MVLRFFFGIVKLNIELLNMDRNIITSLCQKVEVCCYPPSKSWSTLNQNMQICQLSLWQAAL